MWWPSFFDIKINNKMFRAISPKQAENYSNAINVSSRGSRPYNLFSPFTYSQDFKIPVPGQEDLYANSVESIWQGLKVIDGGVDFELFTQKSKKRKGNVEGHLFGQDLLGIVGARGNIYRPAYKSYFDNYIPQDVKEDMLEKAFREGEVLFYDVESNLDIEDTSAPLSHSVFLRECLWDYYHQRRNEVKGEIDKEYDKEEIEHETLAEPLARAMEMFDEGSYNDKRLIVNVLGNYGRYYNSLFDKLKCSKEI